MFDRLKKFFDNIACKILCCNSECCDKEEEEKSTAGSIKREELILNAVSAVQDMVDEIASPALEHVKLEVILAAAAAAARRPATVKDGSDGPTGEI